MINPKEFPKFANFPALKMNVLRTLLDSSHFFPRTEITEETYKSTLFNKSNNSIFLNL